MATRSSVSPGTGQAIKAREPSRASIFPPVVEMFGIIAVVCGAGLAIALLLASYGVDLSAEF
jgi:hypothetical protein